MDLDPHRVLGVPRGVSIEEAEDAYHRLLRHEHPDLHHGAGPERVAHAERRTRELNAAISTLRDADSLRAGAARDRTGGGRDAGAGTDRRRDEAGYATGRSAPDEPASSAPCPWCGEPFVHAADLKDHVFAAHDLRLDRRVRPGLFGGRIHRWTRAAGHLPLWGLIPLNLVLALLVGVLAAQLANETVGAWAFGITLVPTIAVVIDRLFDAAG
jgi:curved DNA-binding protein CbpA